MSEKAEKKYRRQPSVDVKRKWIELFYERKISVKSIADDYGYPPHTVYRVLRTLDPNRKKRSDTGKERKAPMLDVDLDALSVQGESHETVIEILIQEVMRAIASNKKLKASQALLYVGQLTTALKKLRSVQFGQMAKTLDFRIVEGVIRRYEPNATDLQVIEICKEVIAKVKSEGKS